MLPAEFLQFTPPFPYCLDAWIWRGENESETADEKAFVRKGGNLIDELFQSLILIDEKTKASGSEVTGLISEKKNGN